MMFKTPSETFRILSGSFWYGTNSPTEIPNIPIINPSIIVLVMLQSWDKSIWFFLGPNQYEGFYFISDAILSHLSPSQGAST